MGKIERSEVPAEDRERLRRLARDRNTPQKVVWRAKIVLLAGEPRSLSLLSCAASHFPRFENAAHGGFQLPTSAFTPASAPISMSVRRARPRQITMLPGGESPALAR
jgi:hypothetical protein